jgi:hypothetical protein
MKLLLFPRERKTGRHWVKQWGYGPSMTLGVRVPVTRRRKVNATVSGAQNSFRISLLILWSPDFL